MALGATTYTSVTWTTGDVITEAKLDNMVANDQAYDSHAAQGLLLNNDVGYYQKDSGGVNREIMNLDTADLLTLGDGVNEVAPATMSKCRAYLSSQQSDLTDTTWTKVELDSESYDIGGDFDVGNYRYTAPVTGYYFVSAQIRFEDVIADKAYDLAIYVNGAAYQLSRTYSVTGGLGVIVAPNIGTVVPVTAGQYIELYGRVTSTGSNAIDINASELGTHLLVHLLSV